MSRVEIELNYGGDGPLRLAFDGDRFRSYHAGPPALASTAETIRTALAQPLDFPPLAAMCVPGDRVVIVLDHHLPSIDDVLPETIRVLMAAGADPEQMTILQPAHIPARPAAPRPDLSHMTAAQQAWKTHDPTHAAGMGYLASSVNGERIYLARDVLDADLVIPIFAGGFDSVLGYRSPGGLLYPGLSNPDAFQKARGEGHRELRPDNDRPLQQLGDEICWLLGVQFAIGVTPSRVAGTAAAIAAGQWEAVQRQTRQLLNHAWTIQQERRAETVVVAVSEPAGQTGWEEIGTALALAQNLVERDGRIIVLSSLAALPGPGLDLLKSSRSPKAALATLRKEAPPDLVSSLQIASAAAWARVSLLSQLESSLVEELQLSPLETPTEAERLIAHEEDVVLIDGAEHTWGEIVAE